MLELKTIQLGLPSLCDGSVGSHIRIRSDNSTAVACIDRRGSTKVGLNQVVHDIFHWAESRGITLSAAHVAGELNIEADVESRAWKLDAEWMLRRSLCQKCFPPVLDLFATRINTQLPAYVSWRPDSASVSVNAFSIRWTGDELYAFPPFSVIGRVLQKLQEEAATLLTILPVWPRPADPGVVSESSTAAGGHPLLAASESVPSSSTIPTTSVGGDDFIRQSFHSLGVSPEVAEPLLIYFA